MERCRTNSRSIMNLDQETGISIIIAEKLDTGPVCNNYKIQLNENFNALEISEKLSSLATEKILDNVDDILDGKKFYDRIIRMQPMHLKFKKLKVKLTGMKMLKKLLVR